MPKHQMQLTEMCTIEKMLANELRQIKVEKERLRCTIICAYVVVYWTLLCCAISYIYLQHRIVNFLIAFFTWDILENMTAKFCFNLFFNKNITVCICVGILRNKNLTPNNGKIKKLLGW